MKEILSDRSICRRWGRPAEAAPPVPRPTQVAFAEVASADTASVHSASVDAAAVNTASVDTASVDRVNIGPRKAFRLGGRWAIAGLVSTILPVWIAFPAAIGDESVGVSLSTEVHGGRAAVEPAEGTSEPEGAADADQVRNWVDQLDAPLRSQRDAAERSLIEAGPAVLGILPPVEEVSSAESRLRLERILQALAAASVRQTLRGSTLDLTVREGSPDEILRQVRQQSGNRLQWAMPEVPSAISSARLAGPFWPVLDGLLDDWNAGLQAAEEPFSLRIVPRPAGGAARRQAASYAGPFRVQATRFQRFEEPDNTVTLRAGLSVEWEPMLWPVAVWHDAAWNRATTTLGNEAVPRSGGGRREMPLPRTVYPLPLAIDFTLPAEDTALARWTGRFEVLAAVAPYSFVFDLRAGLPRRQSLGDVTVELQSLKIGDNSVAASLRIEYRDVAIPLKSHLAGVFEVPVRLEYPDGTTCDGVIRETLAETDSSAVIHHVFRPPETVPPSSPPERLAATVPLAVQMMEVNYEFSGDRLPPSSGRPSREDSAP